MHTWQPIHWVLSISAFPSRRLRAGQPMRIHRPQPLQRSVAKKGLALRAKRLKPAFEKYEFIKEIRYTENERKGFWQKLFGK